MKTVSFKTVLWAIEYRMGLTPTEDFFEPDAKAIASYINVAVLRYYENSDFPEWTFTEPRTPTNHIVLYSATGLRDIWRVFKLFLRDPNISLPPIDYPFRLLDSGVHVGFEHGPTVWLKYQGIPPTFTSDVWDANTTYDIGDLVYSPISGECYTSLVNGNKANDPSIDDSTNILQEQVQPWQGSDYGIAAQPKIMSMQIPLSSVPALPCDFYMEVRNAAGSVLGSFDYTVLITDTLATITTALRNGLAAVGALSAFTITADTTAHTITFQAPSDFMLPGDSAINTSALTSIPYNTKQIQSYIAGTSMTLGSNQITTVRIGSSQVFPSATYNFSFIEPNGTPHQVSYVSQNQSLAQIVTGIAAAISASTDAFFGTVLVSVDPATGAITFSTSFPVSISATFSKDSSSFWQVVQFPLALFNQVVRDAYGNALRDAGQTDKGGAEEQGAIKMQGEKTGNISVPQDDTLTDQVKVPSRYRAR